MQEDWSFRLEVADDVRYKKWVPRSSVRKLSAAPMEPTMSAYHVSARKANPTSHVPANMIAKQGDGPLWSDRALWVVGAVTAYQSRSAYFTSDRSEVWVPLSTNAFLRPHLGVRHAKAVVDKLVRKGVLECDELSYKSHGYQEGIERDWKEKGSTHDLRVPSLNENLKNEYAIDNPTPPRGKALCYRLTRAYRREPLVAHVHHTSQLIANIERWAARRKAEAAPSVSEALQITRQYKDALTVTDDYQRGTSDAMDRLQDGITYASPCPMGRIHSSPTTVPAGRDGKENMRPYVRLGGERIVSVDVTGSQLILAAEALDLAQMLTDAQTKDIYAKVADIVGVPRNDVKVPVLRVLFGKYGHTDTKVGRALESMYPGLRARAGAKGGSPFARALQRAEADIMVQGALISFSRANPGVPVLSMHDALLVPDGWEHEAEAHILAAWAKEGLRPRLKTSRW